MKLSGHSSREAQQVGPSHPRDFQLAAVGIWIMSETARSPLHTSDAICDAELSEYRQAWVSYRGQVRHHQPFLPRSRTSETRENARDSFPLSSRSSGEALKEAWRAQREDHLVQGQGQRRSADHPPHDAVSSHRVNREVAATVVCNAFAEKLAGAGRDVHQLGPDLHCAREWQTWGMWC